jgi:hypothetical protein
MLVNPALWMTFNQAKDALLTALQEALHTQLEPRALVASHSPRGHDTTPCSVNTLLLAASEAEQQLEASLSDLSFVRSSLVQRLRVVHNLSSPFATLPHELTQDIISLVVNGASDRRAILGLSQVSQKLRRTVLGMSCLFTEANWDYWPCPFLELWCQRARTQLLTIYLDNTTISRLNRGAAPELKALLESYSPQWGVLHMDIYLPRNAIERIIPSVERLLEHLSPSLHTLDLSCNRSSDASAVPLWLRCPPGLRVLRLREIWPVFLASPTSLTDLTCVSLNRWRWCRWLDVLRSCRLVERLIVDLMQCKGHAYEVIMPSAAQVALPSLCHLEIKGMLEEDLPWISEFLSCCDAPNLESMAIQPLDRNTLIGVNGWQIVVRNQFSLPHARFQFQYPFAGTPRRQYKVSFDQHVARPWKCLVCPLKLAYRALHDISSSDGASPPAR